VTAPQRTDAQRARGDRATFVRDATPRWRELEGLLSPGSLDAAEWSRLSALYRAVCADLGRASALELGPDVVRYLEQLAARAHNQLYGGRGGGVIAAFGAAIDLILVQFPVELRRAWPAFVIASVLFYGPFAIGAAGAWWSNDFATSVLPASMLVQMEQMHGDGVARAAGEDAMMAGFYVMNNVGIALRCFASGALVGLGPIYTLVYNGLVMGVVEGHLWRMGAGLRLLEFTSGHTAWELTGVVVAGTAGLKLGWALVVTRGRTRATSLRESGPALYRLVAGATAMLFVAAAIEGFWSASGVPLVGKLIFGAVQVVLVGAWLALGGVLTRSGR
jgi:uncharacterized membrane protein SpoIIM required for sporulation